MSFPSDFSTSPCVSANASFDIESVLVKNAANFVKPRNDQARLAMCIKASGLGVVASASADDGGAVFDAYSERMIFVRMRAGGLIEG